MNKVGKEVLSDSLAQLSRGALRQILKHTETSMALAVKFADDRNAIRREPLYVELERLNLACLNLLTMG